MIIKRVFFIWLMLFPSLVYGQGKIVNESIIYLNDTTSQKREISSTTFFEVGTFLPVIKMVSDTASHEKMSCYYYLKNKPVKVSMDISYIGGIKAMRKYQDSLYWKYYNGDEINCTCLYTILFNDKLKIKEVKIVRRGGYNNSKFDFDSLIKKILLSTDGNWQKENSNSTEKWYFTLGRFWLR